MKNRGTNPQYKPLYTSPFTKSIFKRTNPESSSPKRGCVTISVELPIVRPNESLILVGSSDLLGNWSVERGVKMLDGGFPRWDSPALKCSEELLSSEFKFVIVESHSGDVVAWEEGCNRHFDREQTTPNQRIELPSPLLSTPNWKGAGVAIPLFSLRSESSWGVGDFMDLKMMVDWAVATNQRIIQILPINDSTMSHTWEDSYPYNANSIFALHPQYLSTTRVGELQDSKMQAQMELEAKRLNTLDKIDYVGVNNLKERYMRQLYAERGSEVLAQKGFKEFLASNSYWLEAYALFSLLRDKYNTADFSTWGEESTLSAELLSKYSSKRSKGYKELAYYLFVQYNLHLQLLEAREYARSRGVVFKGDIPIGVSRTSVDVWCSPKLFHLDSQAGAPPDDFSVLGQNWGFPTYNWREMSKDGYAWWGARFRKMSEYFDAYRIDHILGFFRIWEIPLDAIHGLLGHFSPALPLTKEEMQERFGFEFEPRYTQPAINDWILEHLFGSESNDIKRKYFDRNLRFKSQYNTQLKVKRAVADEALCDKLLSLFNEVLFIKDPYQKDGYHPRISAQQSYIYRAMSEEDKRKYDDLYNHFYYHRHNDFWHAEAMSKLPALVGSTEMLTCGEDLGMIPECVPSVMSSESIISLEIQRMPKDPRLSFGEPWNYPYMSVCTTSTHDMNPIRTWLREDRSTSEQYMREILKLDVEVGDDTPGCICEQIIQQHLDSPSMLTILPLQDWLSIDERLRKEDPESERINIPANSRHYWRYRMHLTIEELLSAEAFNDKLREMIAKADR